MDNLKQEAAKCGLKEEELADLAIGGFLSVLKHSEKLQTDNDHSSSSNNSNNDNNAMLEKILEHLGNEASIDLKQYEKIVAKKKGIKLPGSQQLGKLLQLPHHHRNKNKDHDAENTKVMVDTLNNQFEGFTEEKIVIFMKAFIEYIQDEVEEALDVDEILKMPGMAE